MTDKRSLPFPIWMIALDVIGTLLVVYGILGLTGVFSDAVSPGELQAISIAAIVFGVLLMLPLIVTVIRNATSGGRPG